MAQEGGGPSADPRDNQQAEEQSTAPGAPKKRLKPIATIDVVRANLEPSYLAYPIGISGLDALIFESNVVAHFVVNRPSWPFAVVLTPKIVLRMFREASEPVKSPSYMPRVTLFFWFQQEMRDQLALYGSIMLSHHSNGQSGDFFDANHMVNHATGSFSTNYFEFSLYGTGFKGRWFGWSALSLEWHPGFIEDPELRGRYGLWRVHLSSTVLANLPLKGQLGLRLSAILDGFSKNSSRPLLQALERFPLSVRYTITLPGIDLGLYAGYYIGHDYYNIYFDRVVHAFQVGISGGVAPTLISDDDSGGRSD
jgi:hypothetical protein